MGLSRDRRRCLISAGFFHIREFSAPKWQKPEGNVKENRPFGENDKVRLTNALDQGKIIISYLFGCSLLRKNGYLLLLGFGSVADGLWTVRTGAEIALHRVSLYGSYFDTCLKRGSTLRGKQESAFMRRRNRCFYAPEKRK